jgi:colanic acid/amylovoran biosynthesis glycosyltransferase
VFSLPKVEEGISCILPNMVIYGGVSNMKIAFIVSVFPKLSETFILSQITGLLDLGHEVEIFAMYDPHEEKKHLNIEKYHLMVHAHYCAMPERIPPRVLKGIFLTIKNLFKCPLRTIKSLNVIKYGKHALSLEFLYMLNAFTDSNKTFDIVHCHFGPNGALGAFLKDIGIPGKYITSFHGYDVNSYPNIVGNDVYKDLFSKGDLFTCNTNFTKQRVMELGCDESKITILAVGLDIQKFNFSIKTINDNEPIKILTVARLVEKKGHEYAIKAIAKVVNKHSNVIYLIAGDGPLRNQLQSLVTQLEIDKYVQFLGDVRSDEVINLYHKSHIFILPSVTAADGDREGQGLVLQEAQAAGLPVISTLHNGIPDGVLDGISAFLVPERDPEALANKLEYLISRPELWPSMGQEGRRFVEGKYNINNLNEQLAKIYLNLL